MESIPKNMRILQLIRLTIISAIILSISVDIAAKPESKKKPPESKIVKSLKKEIKILDLKLKKMRLKNDMQEIIFKSKIASIKNKTRMLKQKNAYNKAFLKEKMGKLLEEKERMNIELARIRLKNARLGHAKTKYQFSIIKLKNKIKNRKYKKVWKSYVNREIKYYRKPYQKRKLFISDRRIALNGPIFYRMANDIVQKIHYFNNKSQKLPIFIVIDSSPGGSVIAGYRILMAMQASQAPVYVVLKSYAASMAAVIVALAKHSYAYPNAIILHHQVSSRTRGNITQQKERLEISEEWMRRLIAPVARKMGISLQKFVKRMYKHNSDGDWREFANNAKRLKWVNRIVREIKEDSVIEIKPKKKKKSSHHLQEKIDSKGRPYILLPRLSPYDVYFIHNPDRYYR